MHSPLLRLVASLVAIALSLVVAVPAHAEPPSGATGAPRPIVRAPRAAAPADDDVAPVDRSRGPFMRLAAGASYLRGSLSSGATRIPMSIAAFSMPLSVGSVWNATALHIDADLDTGPSPKLHLDGDTVQDESHSMSRYFLGVGFTRYLGRTHVWSVFGSVGYSRMMFETREFDSRAVGGANGLAARVGVGLDLYRGRWGRLGLVSSVRGARYRDASDETIIAGMIVDAGLSITVGR
jgi:hypothetical protein